MSRTPRTSWVSRRGEPDAETTRASILVVDDDLEMGKLAADIARDQGHGATTLTAPSLVMPTIEQGDFDLLVTDVRMPEIDGVELIERVHQYDPRIAIVAMTAFGSIDVAIRAVRAGAFDYLPKPFQPTEMALRIESALARRRMGLELAALRYAVDERFGLTGLVGRSRALQDIVGLIRRVADAPATVLVAGPSGSGKELVARALHNESRRRSRKFVAVNCAAIPESLIEAELFGVRRGAFTDARADRAGMFQEADGGTLLLDEIGELAPAVQAKLLRVLQEKEVRRVGSAVSEPVDVRVIAATNRDLRASMGAGAFREDLFYRLAVIEITIPALRERVEDILPLAEHFLAQAAARAGKSIEGFSGAAAKRLLAHDWPGNIRELENAVERAVALCDDGYVTPEELPETMRSNRPTGFLEAAAEQSLTMAEVERAYAEVVLKRVGGNKVRAAAILGLDRRTLQRWFGGSSEAESAE